MKQNDTARIFSIFSQFSIFSIKTGTTVQPVVRTWNIVQMWQCSNFVFNTAVELVEAWEEIIPSSVFGQVSSVYDFSLWSFSSLTSYPSILIVLNQVSNSVTYVMTPKNLDVLYQRKSASFTLKLFLCQCLVNLTCP